MTKLINRFVALIFILTGFYELHLTHLDEHLKAAIIVFVMALQALSWTMPKNCPHCKKEVKKPIRKMSGWLCEHCRYVLPWTWFE